MHVRVDQFGYSVVAKDKGSKKQKNKITLDRGQHQENNERNKYGDQKG